MKRNILFFFVFLIGSSSSIFSQTTLEEYFKAKNVAPKSAQDIFYTVEKQGNGATPKRGDYVKLKYVGQLLDGTVFDESGNESYVFRLGYRQVISGWEIGIPLLKVGTKGTLFLPAEKAYGARAMGKIPATSPLIFKIEVEQILNEAAYDQYNIDLEKREKIAFETAKKEQLAKDLKIINDFSSEKKIKTTKTNSGLSYSITKKGKGNLPQKGDMLVVEYEGFLPDGTAFDSNKDKAPFQFVLGAKKVLEGWEEGFSFFNKGSEGYLMLPSQLAYKGTSIAEKNIPAFAVLIFKVKVKDIITKK
jgi:FKBP-type peptidyl-prolyl cis-trans isomerase FkpA